MKFGIPKLLILKAGDGDRTRDVQLGKLDVSASTNKLLIENEKRF